MTTNEYGVSVEDNEKVLELDSGGSMHNFVNILKSTESYDLKGRMLWYMNCRMFQ